MAGRSSSDIDRGRRARVLTAIAFLPFLLIGGRLIVLQLVEGSRNLELSESNWMRLERIPALRGDVLDRKGRVLADNSPAHVLTFDPFDKVFRRDPPEARRVIERIAGLLRADPDSLYRKVNEEKYNSYRSVRLLRNLPIGTVTILEEHRADLPGVSIEVEPIRHYPHGTLASHLLGYVGEIGKEELEKRKEEGYEPGAVVGRAGIEASYEELLRGRDGVRYIEVNAMGRRSELFVKREPVLPEKGRSILLTIDLDLQKAAEAALDSAKDEKGRIFPPSEGRGAVVAIRPETGEVLALASRPVYDPNDFAGGISAGRWREYHRPGYFPLLNRAVQSAYPPGSTFKILAAIAALEDGVTRPETRFRGCTGGYFFGDRVFHCWKEEGHGVLELSDAIMRSCDVYFYQLGLQIGVDRLHRYVTAFHMNERTGIDLPQERRGFAPSTAWYEKRWGKHGVSRGAILNLTIGQGELLFTPLELAVFTAAVANGGTIVRPRVLLRTESAADLPAGLEGPGSPTRDTVELSPATLDVVREAMRRVVEDPGGTGGRARIPGISTGGKTGTAQNPGEDHALFICFAPVEAPEIAIAVVLEERGHGGSVAAPVARKILERYFEGRNVLLTPAVRDETPAAAGD